MVNLSTELYNLFDTDGIYIVDFLQWLVQSYHLPADLTVLDIGCGPGRLLEPLAKVGWQVVGMEPNAEYHAAAVAIAGRNDHITVLAGGFDDIVQDATYDLIIAVNAPFAYLPSMEARHSALVRMIHALKPGGVLFLDFPNFLHALMNYRAPAPSISESPNGDMIRRIIQHDIDFHSGAFTHTDLFYINDRLADKQEHKMYIITVTEMLYLLKEAGYSDVMTFNSYGARANQRISGARLMVSARRGKV